MNKESQRIAIAEACGWTEHKSRVANYWKLHGEFVGYGPPDYLNDLNAMHEAEKVLTDDEGDRMRYFDNLAEITADANGGRCSRFLLVHPSATQRAEAFLRTLGLWKDDASHLSMMDSRTVSINKKE
jgi:hypothetical protein